MARTQINQHSWRFDKMAEQDPARASSLETCGDQFELIEALRRALHENFEASNLRLGCDQSERTPEDRRVVVQFRVGEALFDWFFNGRDGYRAHFREHPAAGLSFNADLVSMLRSELGTLLPQNFLARKLTAFFEDAGATRMTKRFVLASLAVNSWLPKVWWCGKLIEQGGGIRPLPIGLVGTRIEIGDSQSWPAFSRADGDAWLDVKGAFLGRHGLYQPKCAIRRAVRLHFTGEA